MRRAIARSTDLIAIDYEEILAESPQAIRFRIDGRPHWLPRREIRVDEGEKTVTMGEWLAVNEGIV